MSGFLSMPWSFALSALRMKRRDAEAGDGRRVLEREEHAEARALVRRELEEVAALPQDLAALDHVGRVAHQRIGERRLARAVGAHDRVDLALGRRSGRCPGGSRGRAWPTGATRRPRMTRCCRSAVVWSVTGVVRAPWGVVEWGRRRAAGARSARVIEFEGRGDRVADADPQQVDGAAVTNGRRSWRVRDRRVAQNIGAIGPSSARRTSLIADGLGGTGELIAAMGAAGADDEAGFAQVDDELLEVGARQVLLGGDPGQAGRAGAVVAGELDHQPHAVLALRREGDGAGAVVGGPLDGGGSGSGGQGGSSISE